jgi:dienelactone hydrolase
MYDPYYNQEEFQEYKYDDQPTLRLLDWTLKRRQGEKSFQEPGSLRRNIQRFLLHQVEADLAGLEIDLTIAEEHCDNKNKYVELLLNIGHVVEYRATLAIPSNNNINTPVFLCLHGHQHEGRHWTLKKGPGAALTRAGYICLAPDIPGLGDSRGVTENTTRSTITYDLLIHNALLIGWSLNGLRIWVLKQWMHKLKQHKKLGKQVKRFACAGFSLGGELALYLSTIFPGIAPVYISHYCCPWEQSYWSKLHCKCAYLPGLMRLTSLTDIYKLIAPRALAVEVGRQDKSFPIEGTMRLLEQLKKHYGSISVKNNFHYLVKKNGHVFHCEPKTLSFLAQHVSQ